MQATGYPNDVITDEEKRDFVEKYEKNMGLKLDVSKIAFNSGLRYISKLALNSLWGKFGMRNGLSHNKIISSPSEYFNVVYDRKLTISMLIPVSDKAIRMVYRQNKEFVDEHGASNAVIALWTTSAAR